MALTDKAPFAPTPSVIKVLETFRDTGLGGGVITPELLDRMGMGEEIARRVILTLRLLELIDENGTATRNLVAFKQASSAEYKQVLANLLFDVYAPVFAITGTDPSAKDVTEVEDAFRTFNPDSLRKRMVTLFLGLCEYAGITPEGTRRSAPRQRPVRPVRPPKPTDVLNPPPMVPPANGQGGGDLHTVQLRSGGSVSVAVDVNLWALTPEDRDFVLHLVDKVKEYGARRELPAVSSAMKQEDSS